MKRFDPFHKLNDKYGAPMGRRSSTKIDYVNGSKLCARHQSGTGGYDKGGAYWGGPSDVYAVWEYGKGEEGVKYVRAACRHSAINQVKVDYWVRCPIIQGALTTYSDIETL